jgi:hypothetical protein
MSSNPSQRGQHSGKTSTNHPKMEGSNPTTEKVAKICFSNLQESKVSHDAEVVGPVRGN